MRLSLALSPLLACLAAVPASRAGEEFRFSGRAGLHGVPGFQEGGDELALGDAMSENGWITGTSTVGGMRAAWVASPEDGVSRRVGLFTGEGFGSGSGSGIATPAKNGWVRGSSVFRTPGGVTYSVPWMARGAAGVTMRGGLTGPDYTSSAGAELSRMERMTDTGFAWGWTSRYRGGAVQRGLAVWVMNGHTGAVIRGGFFEGPQYTKADDGTQQSYGGWVTDAGWFVGSSTLYNGSKDIGGVVWVTRADTGVTRRMGLFEGEEYRRSTDGGQRCRYGRMTDDGWLTGTANRYTAEGGDAGTAAWTGNVVTGVTRRIGFFEGAAYTHPVTGRQESAVGYLNDSGVLSGSSAVYRNAESPPGYIAWLADARTGAIRRVGLYEGEEFLWNGVGVSWVSGLKNSGWMIGSSERYQKDASGETRSAGETVWMGSAVTGVVSPVGLTEGTLTSASGKRRGSFYDYFGMTESGWAIGRAEDYRRADGTPGEELTNYAYWVAGASTGRTLRLGLGLTSSEFTSSSGNYGDQPGGMTEEGLVWGVTSRYRGEESAGGAAWVADAATGKTTRLGYTEGKFTRASDGTQSSGIFKVTGDGLVLGTSIDYSLAEPYQDSVPWAADAATGQMWGLGLDGGYYTPPHQIILSESGLAAGQTFFQRGYHGPTAWVQDVRSGTRVAFDLSRPDGASVGHSEVRGMTPGGTVWGIYTLFKGHLKLGERPFLWEKGLGTLLFEEASAAAGYEYLTTLAVNAQGYALASGRVAGSDATGFFFGRLPAALSPASGARVTDLARLPDGKFRLSFHTDAAVRITLQSSADLSTWKDAQTIDAPAGASHMDIEPDPVPAPNRYWRLKTAPASP